MWIRRVASQKAWADILLPNCSFFTGLHGHPFIRGPICIQYPGNFLRTGRLFPNRDICATRLLLSALASPCDSFGVLLKEGCEGSRCRTSPICVCGRFWGTYDSLISVLQ